jgi:phospholipid-binding lipoprotein MlaA
VNTLKETVMKIDYGQGIRRSMAAAIFGVSLAASLVIATASDAEQAMEAVSSAALGQQPAAIIVDQQYAQAAALDVAPMAATAPGDDFDEDPWEGFNEKMFWFNREVLDRYVLKPVATGWDFIFPDPVQRGIHNVFDNLGVVRRVVNNTLQLKMAGAATELARFTINSTIGVVGFFDVAKDAFGIEQRDEDTGQTFGVWGMGPGPYLVLPFLPPLTVRDGVGYAFDSFMYPHAYFMPWWGIATYNTTNVVNERSLNLDRFERVAESTVDLYGAVRNGYLQRRAAAIKQ